MIQAATRYNVNGVEVVVTTITAEKYMPDFAFLVQKMVRMENLDAIFAVALMENKIYVIGRSRVEDVDVGAIIGQFGGGGQPYAAAASIKGKTLVQTENQLIELLYSNISARRLAKDLMSSPAITVDSQVSCRSANDLLTRYNVNALLVTGNGDGCESLLGYITRQVIEKAKTSENRRTREEALSAQKWLGELDVEKGNLDTIRLKMITYIIKLMGGK